jgi:hypothetical protein
MSNESLPANIEFLMSENYEYMQFQIDRANRLNRLSGFARRKAKYDEIRRRAMLKKQRRRNAALRSWSFKPALKNSII